MTNAHHDELWALWHKRWERAIGEWWTVHGDRALYRQLLEAIVERTPNASGIWPEHYQRLYIAKQTMAVRRMMDTGPNAESLGRMLKSMESDPRAFSLDRFMSSLTNRDDEWLVKLRQARFDNLRSLKGDFVDPKWARGILDRLKPEVDEVVEYATRVIAHSDERPFETSLTMQHLHNVVEHVDEAMQEVAAVFTNALTLMETTFSEDWKAVFREAVFDPHKLRWPWGYPDY